MKLDTQALTELREALEYARLDNIRSDLCNFAEYVMVDEKKRSWKLGSHHREWYRRLWDQVCDVVQPGKHLRSPDAKDNLIIMAPREHGKTSTVVCFLLYCFGLNSKLRIKIVSRSDRVAIDIVGQVKKNITKNPRLREVFPHLQKDPDGTWTGSAFDILKVDEHGQWDEGDLGIKDASLEAYGVTAAATGGRADIIIFDDIIGSREAVQEPARLEKIAQTFYTDWLNIGGKRHIMLGTPWTPDDVVAQVSQNDDWQLWKKPAISDAGQPLWPEYWPIEKLMARKRAIGAVAFDLQFMLTGIRAMDTWWTQDIVDTCKDRKLRFHENPFGVNCQGIVIGLDPAASLRRDGSYSCAFVLAYDEFRSKAVLDIRRARYSARDLAAMIIELCLTYNPEVVYVENNALQQFVIELIELEAEARNLQLKVPLKGYFVGSQKWNVEVGLPRIVADMQNGKCIIPWGDEAHQGEAKDPLHECVLCQWIDEMLGFPYETDTTDMIMAYWLAATGVDSPKKIGDVSPVVSSRRVSMDKIEW